MKTNILDAARMKDISGNVKFEGNTLRFLKAILFTCHPALCSMQKENDRKSREEFVLDEAFDTVDEGKEVLSTLVLYRPGFDDRVVAHIEVGGPPDHPPPPSFWRGPDHPPPS